MRVREATIQDLDALVEGNAAMARETEAVRLDGATLRAGVAALLEGRAPGVYRVCELDDRVAGQILVTYEWSDWRNRDVWWIQSVYVWPEFRERGVYRALHTAVIAAARAAGAAGVRLYVDARNTRAQAVYTALGMNGDHYRVFETMF
jgi:ribosomal protein S18 acetylase RimI-like enzyme